MGEESRVRESRDGRESRVRESSPESGRVEMGEESRVRKSRDGRGVQSQGE